jgi:protein gp37
MADRTKIGWTDKTWNPVTGCDAVSEGCGSPFGPGECYAKIIAERHRGSKAFPVGFDLQLRPEKLEEPLHWRKTCMVFVNSMSDLFHKDIPDEFIGQAFDTMERADWHTYQTLTKRSSLMRDFLRRRYGSESGPSHMWFGVSIENAGALVRLRHLQEAPAGLRFLSVEPLLGPIGEIDLTGISWTIVGGQSGRGYQTMDLAWAREVYDQCRNAGVAFFMKQDSGFYPGKQGRVPDDLWNVKEWPGSK